MPALEPVVLEERKFSFRHIGPRAAVYSASPAADLILLNRIDMVARPLPTTNLSTDPDFANGTYNLRLQDAGDFSFTWPNSEASDGVPWRLRFDDTNRLQWLEVMVDDYLEGNFVINKVDRERDHVQIDGFDGWFCLKSAFERDYTVVQAPRDTIERGTMVWKPLAADNFLSSTLSPIWTTTQVGGGTVTDSATAGCVLAVPALTSSTNNITAGPGTGTDGGGGALAWANPNYVTSKGAYNAISSNPSTSIAQNSNNLKASNFGLPTIPGGATINGITVKVFRTGGFVVDHTIQLMKGLAGVGSNKADVNTLWGVASSAVYGSSSDLWGTTWTPADINTANFGVLVQASVGISDAAKVDYVQVTVTYTTTPAAPIAAIDTGTISCSATAAWRAQCAIATTTLSGFDGIYMTVTESNGDAYSVAFLGSTAIGVMKLGGTVVSRLDPGSVPNSVIYSLMLESDGFYVNAFLNGQLVGSIWRNNPSATSLQSTIQITGGGVAASAAVLGGLLECQQPFLMAGTDKGDYVLPGSTVTFPAIGLHARYSNNADLQSAAQMLMKVHTPPRMATYGNSSSNEYQDQQDTEINAQANPLPGASTSFWSCIWYGAIYLKLSAGTYTMNLTLPAHANNQAVRMWVGKTQLGQQVVNAWNFTNTSGQAFYVQIAGSNGTDGGAGTVGSPYVIHLPGWQPYNGGTVARDGWYPIKVEYAVSTTAAAAPVLRFTNIPANYTDPGGTNLVSGAQSTVIPPTSLSPLGCDDNRYQGTTHFDLVQKTANSFGYQLSLEPYAFETLGMANQVGYFPGVLAPRIREGTDFDPVLEPDLHPRQPSDALDDYGNITDSTDSATSIWGNGAGFQNGLVGQLQSNVYDPTSLTEALFDIQAWQDASDASFADLLVQTLNSELGLRIGPWQSISASPHGRPRLANIWPLQGTLAAMRWRPGDGLRVQARTIAVDDTSPRQLWLVTRGILPNGVQSTSIGLASTPNQDASSWSFQQKKIRPRDPVHAVVKQIHRIQRWQRNYQRTRQTLVGHHQKAIPIQAGATSPFESEVALLPTDTIIDACVRVTENYLLRSLGIVVNGIDQTSGLDGPWTVVPFTIQLLKVAQVASDSNSLRVSLHNRDGSAPTQCSWQLIVDVLR